MVDWLGTAKDTHSDCQAHTYAEEGKSLIVSLLFRYSLQIVCVCVWLQVCVFVCVCISFRLCILHVPHTSFVKLDKRHLAFCNQQTSVVCMCVFVSRSRVLPWICIIKKRGKSCDKKRVDSLKHLSAFQLQKL